MLDNPYESEQNQTRNNSTNKDQPSDGRVSGTYYKAGDCCADKLQDSNSPESKCNNRSLYWRQRKGGSRCWRWERCGCWRKTTNRTPLTCAVFGTTKRNCYDAAPAKHLTNLFGLVRAVLLSINPKKVFHA